MPRKKVILTVTIGAIMLLVIGVGIVLALTLPGSRSVMVKSIEGSVEARKGEQGVFEPARVGQKLRAGDALRTGTDGKALLVLDDGTGMEIAADSSIVLKAVEGTTQSPVTRILLNAGKVFNIIPTEPRPGSTYEIETPHSLSAVRGSMMSVAYTEGAGSETTCLTGHCQVAAGGAETDLTGGKAVSVDVQGQVSAVADMTPAQKHEWVAVIDDARAGGVNVDQAVGAGCSCVGPDLVCQDGTQITLFPTCTRELPPEPTVAPTATPEPQRIEFALADGTPIVGTFYAPSIPPAPGVLIVPMLGTTQADWQPLIAALRGEGLASPGYAVFIFDLPEHGESGGTWSESGTLEATALALELLRGFEGVDPDHIVITGGSVGADAAVDECNEGCVGAIPISPGSFLGVDFGSALTQLRDEKDPPVLCIASEGDSYSASTCKDGEAAGLSDYQTHIYQGDGHGFSFLYEENLTPPPGIIELIMGWLEEHLPLTL